METLIFGLDYVGCLSLGRNIDDFDKVIGVVNVEPISDASGYILLEIVCSNNAEAIDAYFNDNVSNEDIIAML